MTCLWGRGVGCARHRRRLLQLATVVGGSSRFAKNWSHSRVKTRYDKSMIRMTDMRLVWDLYMRGPNHSPNRPVPLLTGVPLSFDLMTLHGRHKRSWKAQRVNDQLVFGSKSWQMQSHADTFWLQSSIRQGWLQTNGIRRTHLMHWRPGANYFKSCLVLFRFSCRSLSHICHYIGYFRICWLVWLLKWTQP